jgi:hypothetical protein
VKSTPRSIPNIVRAMDGIFEPWFRGDSWSGWKSVLKATAGLEMSDDEIAFFKSIAGGREPPRKRPREAWIIGGRRGGKDSAISLIAAHAAATFNPKGILRPGERAVVICTAPDRDTGKIIKNYIAAFFETVPSLQRMITRTTDDVLELSNQVDISVMTSNWRTVRGRPILCAILDEVAMLDTSEEAAAPDIELYNAMLPGMSTISSAQLFGISSPHAKKGILYQKFASNFGVDSDDVLVIQAASHILNPTLDTRDRDRMMIEDPARGRAEWFAIFRDDLVQFIDPQVVDRCVMKGRVELPPVPGIAYVAAVDPSGGSSDSMTLAIAHADDRGVGILDLVAEWRAPFSPQEVVGEIVEVLRRYNVSSVVGDRYGGEWCREPFRNQRIDYVLADQTRSEAYLVLLPAINSGRIELLDNRRLISQLCALERRVARGGRDSVDHQRGGKDDVINAAALALCGAALKPMSGPENWLEFYRRELVKFTGANIPPAPGLGFSFEQQSKQPEPLIKLYVPVGLTGDVPLTGARYSPRFEGGRAYIEVTREHAKELLQYEVWKAANRLAAKEIVV